MKSKSELTGIDGWLIIPIIGLFVTIAIQFLYLADSFLYYYLEDVFEYMLFNIILIVLAGITLYCIFKKLKLARTMGIVCYSVFGLFNLLFINPFMIVGSIIWLMYFIKSERVKNTFVN